MSKEIKRQVIPGVRYINLDKARVEYLKETFADNMKAMLSEYTEQLGQSGFLYHGEIFLITTATICILMTKTCGCLLHAASSRYYPKRW